MPMSNHRCRIIILLMLIGIVWQIKPASVHAATNADLILFFAGSNTSWGNAYVIESNGTNMRPVSDGLITSADPSWSPDGEKIFFRGLVKEESFERGFFVAGADGSNLTQIFEEDQGFAYGITVSPDGETVAFNLSTEDHSGAHIWLMNTDGSSLRQLTDDYDYEYFFQWLTPDIIEYYAQVPTTDGNFESQTLQIGIDGQPVENVEAPLNLSPDGTKHITYAFDETGAPVPDEQGINQLFVVDVATDEQIQVTDGPCPPFGASWSPDGTQFAYYTRCDIGKNSGVYVAQADGSGIRVLTTGQQLYSHVQWRPGAGRDVNTDTIVEPTPADLDETAGGTQIPQPVAGTAPVTWMLTTDNTAGEDNPNEIQGLVDVVVGPDGLIYIADGLTYSVGIDWVRAFNPDGSFRRSVRVTAYDTRAFAVMADGRIQVLDPSRDIFGEDVQVGNADFTPTDVVTGLDGRIYALVANGISDDGARPPDYYSIAVFSPELELQETWFEARGERLEDGLTGLTIGPDGNLYLLISDTATLRVLDATDGTTIQEIPLNVSLSEDEQIANSVAVESDGSLYIAVVKGVQFGDPTFRVLRLDAAGQPIEESPVLSGGAQAHLDILPDDGLIIQYIDFDTSAIVRLDFDGSGVVAAPSATDATTTPPNDTAVNCTITTANPVNRRSQAGTEFAASGQLLPDEVGQVIGQARGSDGIIWWQLADETWVRSDVVEESGDCEQVPTIAN